MVHRKIVAKITANKWKSAFVGLVLLVILAFVSGMVAIGGTVATPALSKEAAASKAIDYINTNLLQGQTTATLTSVSESDGLYQISLSISGRTYPSYITKDGKLLFPTVVDMSGQAATTTATNQPAANFAAPKSEKPNVKMFVMSFCPYGQQAETGLAPVHALLGDKITIEPHFVIYGDYQGGSPQYCISNGTLCSMHGLGEVHEDIRQMCVYKTFGADVFWKYVGKINSDCTAGNIDSCWETVAKNTAGIDLKRLNDCYLNEGLGLARAEKALDEKYGVQGSPTIFVNDVQYNGDRSADAFKQAVCSGFATAPAECAQTVTGNATGGQTAAASGAGCGG